MKIYLSIMAIIMLLLICVNCTNKSKNIKNQNQGFDNRIQTSKNYLSDEKQSLTSFDPGISYLVEPLDYYRFTRIKNDQEAFSQFMIIFGKRTNEPFVFYQSDFTGGRNTTGSRLYSEIEFETTLNLWRKPPFPYLCYYEHVFDINILDGIFNNIDSNYEYYFNSEEYEGISYPYLTSTPFLHDKNYIFSIIIIIPNPPRPSYPDYYYSSYMINKSMDELIPDTPLYDLFQEWETNLIPPVLQHEEYCD